MTPLLDVRSLSVEYKSRGVWQPAVSDVSFAVDEGETVAIVGESGSGKSTTASAVLGMLASNARITAGEVLYRGRSITAMSERERRGLRGRGIGYVPQDPGSSLDPTMRIGNQVAESLVLHKLADKRTAAASAIDLLDKVGIDRPYVRARQFPHELSGGMRQRVLIAIALIGGADLLIADEPTSALDATVSRRVLDHVASLAAERNLATVLITHDLALAVERADRVVVMQGGRIVEVSRAQDVLDNPTDDYTRMLVSKAPSLSTHPLVEPRRPATDTLLTVENVTRSFGAVTAVADVSVTLDRGRTLGLLGESGSGKSTTARIVVGVEKPDSGRVVVAGVDISTLRGAALRAARKDIAMVYQNPFTSLDPRMRVEQIIAEPLRVFREGSSADRKARARELADQVALHPELLARKPRELSGGQRQRVAIARALALDPKLVILDEAVSALDVSVQAQILELLVRLQNERNIAYLFISHDLAVVRQICDDVAVMRGGQVLESGSTAAVFDNPTTDYTRDLLGSVPSNRQEATAQ
ncbi:ABC transporter ATP-binding protein [Rhodococcus sp. Eu-32]|uniref:dipeptide ABC transporter ATP-binding protein n=1 Tax=Rhodococcus sp. Eu-32 TaxID=1017319 RepID=UPI000DF1594F|nr:ABC transporter ATP-binding protein [Rhodococcus sp. Eu-32]RRQ29415.1 ABC transporter ATP-binding protein [Rhodococcus sp. Eu-32]